MTEFRNRGLKVVVDTTQEAEFDFASHQISRKQQERIAANLKKIPISEGDRVYGDVNLREAVPGWDVAFVRALDGAEWVILIIGAEPAGQMEEHFEYLRRSGMKALPRPVQELLKGRQKKR